jgi:hypothetical protein
MNHAVEQTLRSGEIIRRLRSFVTRGEVARQRQRDFIRDRDQAVSAFRHDAG